VDVLHERVGRQDELPGPRGDDGGVVAGTDDDAGRRIGHDAPDRVDELVFGQVHRLAVPERVRGKPCGGFARL
jgi:hypothetical protein